MKLMIDTTKNNDIEAFLADESGVILSNKISAQFSQAEKLLPLIDKMLKKKKIKLSEIKEVVVCNEGVAQSSDITPKKL